MIAISPEVTPVLKKFELVRNCDEDVAPKIRMATTSSARPVSQRTARCAVALSQWPGPDAGAAPPPGPGGRPPAAASAAGLL
jgi:hypothetical protein